MSTSNYLDHTFLQNLQNSMEEISAHTVPILKNEPIPGGGDPEMNHGLGAEKFSDGGSQNGSTIPKSAQIQPTI